MSNSDPVSVLKKFYDAEAAYIASDSGDFGPIAATLDEECVLFQPQSLPYGGVWRGHAGFEDWMKAFGQQWSSLEVHDPEVFSTSDAVFSRSTVHAVSRTNGRSLEWPLLQFFRIRDQRILELQPFYWDTAELLSVLRLPPV